MFRGIAVSNGVAIGKAYILDASKFCLVKRSLEPGEVPAEIQRFRDAIEKTKVQMQEIKKKATKIAEKYAIILDTYSLLLEDDMLVSDTIESIKNGKLNAEWALTKTQEKFTHLFNNINDEYLKGKQDDLELLVQAIIRNLIGHTQESLSEITEPVVLIAHTLTPSDTLMMPRNYILGLATEAGGKTSHVGIFASALGIPAVVGIQGLHSKVNSGALVIVDGIDGNVFVDPTEKKIQQYRNKQENFRRYEQQLLENIDQSAETLDGHRVNLRANIESGQEVKTLKKFGAEGVGLFRTEFLYLTPGKLPTENDLCENFKNVARDLDPHPVVIRTMDIGLDKNLPDFKMVNEDNPALGLRGIRLSLSYPEIFITQLKGILRASLYGDIKILYPMVSFADEIVQANHFLKSAKNDLRNEGIPFNENIEVGAMIETPSAAICIEDILEEVDFISIGTNDLIQYILAVDRVNENVAHLYKPYHPSILKMLKHIFLAAEKVGKKVSICGELGGDPLATMVLMGLGKLNELSMDPHSIPKVKKIIRAIKLSEAKEMADHILTLSSAESITQYISSEMRKRLPSDFDRDLSFAEKQGLKQ